MLYVRKTLRKNYIMEKGEKQGQVLGFKGRDTAAGKPVALILFIVFLCPRGFGARVLVEVSLYHPVIELTVLCGLLADGAFRILAGGRHPPHAVQNGDARARGRQDAGFLQNGIAAGRRRGAKFFLPERYRDTGAGALLFDLYQ